MLVMARVFELEIGERTNRYVVERELDDGRVILRSQTEVERMHEQHGSEPLTAGEFEELIAPHIRPPDGEG